MRAHRVPPHRSLVMRLLATSILVAVCATVTTAWLVVQSTTRAVSQEQGRALSDDTSVYDALLGYAATHTDWSGVGPIVAERARKLGRRITLTTEDRQVIADSAGGPALGAARPSATVDPLRTDPGLTGGAERIDSRAVGPYRLTGRERQSLRAVIRVAAVTGAVLLLAILVTVLVGRRLVRPLRTLAEAARKPVEDQARVPVTTNDEIGYLATALNDLAARRERTESQRKAMVSDVAHELRTPLTNMRSWLEAAQDGLAPADQQLLGLLLEEAVLLQHIIDDLRDLAAADADTLRVHPEPVYVNDALEQVAEAHRGAAETAAVRLVTEAEADPQVVVDPVRLRQLVGNLVSNAVRHTPSGGTVTVRSRVADGELTVQVADTGTGIAAADLPKIFDRFWRADGSRTRSTGGSGLGLAIARKLTEAHGGTISVSSAPGAGSTFTVRMPVALTLA